LVVSLIYPAVFLAEIGVRLTFPLVAAGLVVWLWAGEVLVVRRMGLLVASDHIELVGRVTRRTIPLSAIKHVDLQPIRQDQQVSITLDSGVRVWAPTLIYGNWGPFTNRGIRWEGGAAAQMLERLSAHLASLRAPAAPTD
jgi:hypothetical protein